MASKPAVAPATKSGSKQIVRKRRNSSEKKCLPKSLKVQFMGSDRLTFKSLLASWKDSRKKTSLSM